MRMRKMIDYPTIVSGCRRIRHMSLKELSRRSGVSIHAITSMEKGHHVPRVDTLEYVIKAMGFDVSLQISERETEDDDDNGCDSSR